MSNPTDDTPGTSAPKHRRPNANYPLTEKKPDGEELVFYYSRERRLASAPENVQALYNGAPQKRFGLFRSLTATKPLATLFVSIVILCAAIMVIVTFGFNDSSVHTLGGNDIAVSAIKFQGETIVALTKTAKDNRGAYTGLVDIAVSPAAPEGSDPADYPVFAHRIFFSLNPEETYRFSLPFEADKLVFVLMGEQQTAQFTLKTE
jgi:hypothetical protein